MRHEHYEDYSDDSGRAAGWIMLCAVLSSLSLAVYCLRDFL